MPEYRHRVYPLVKRIFSQKLVERSDRFPHWGDRFPGGRVSYLNFSSPRSTEKWSVWCGPMTTRAPKSAFAARWAGSARRIVRLPKNVKVLRGDLLSEDWHASPHLDGVTHVLHLAASTSFGNSRGIRTTNVGGALSVAKAMRGRRLERFVYTGTAAICGASPKPVVHEDDYPNERATHLVAYTRSKAEAERLLAEQFSDLPVVFARPSIVVGHTELGCKPSGSIFWVLRAVEALRFITWDLDNRIDVVPVDWAASALGHLLFAPSLKHNRYHVSAGKGSSIRWKELAAEYARLRGGTSQDRYEIGGMRQLTVKRVMQAAGDGHPRHLLHALELYYRFCSLDLVFDNCRLLKEGVPGPAALYRLHAGVRGIVPGQHL